MRPECGMLVGRGAELEQLVDMLGAGQPVALVGEAGVGKTALIRQAISGSGRRMLEGGALSTLSWLPYLPLRRAIRRPIPDGDEVFVAGEIQRAVGRAVLFLDDLHWADTHTRALLGLLVPRTAIVTAVRRGDPAAPATLEHLKSLQFRLMDVETLAEGEGIELVKRLRPTLGDGAARKIVLRAGGNPLLIEELATHGGPTDSLRLALAARLRQLGAAAQRGMGLLALAGHSLPREALGDAASELIESGMAVEADGRVAVRHALLAETFTAQLTDDQRRRHHSDLARIIHSPGNAARHHAAAGEHRLARRAALSAAEATRYPGEQAQHLALAAQCSDGKRADDLRLRAAHALIAAHDHGDIDALLDKVENEDPVVQAEVWLLRYFVREVGMDFSAAREAWRRGMELADGTGSDVEVRLRIEAGRIAYLLDLDPQATEIAEAGLALARSSGKHEVLAEFVLASALWTAWDPRWRSALEHALAVARAAGEVVVEYRATNNLVLGLMLSGEPERARKVAEEGMLLARERHLGRWERRMAVLLIRIDTLLGAAKAAVERGHGLLEEFFETQHRRDAAIYLAHALFDTGRYAEARRLLEHVREETAPDGPHPDDASVVDYVDALILLAEADLWAGKPRAAITRLEKARRFDVSPLATDTVYMLPLIDGWARLDLGLPVAFEPFEVNLPLWAAAPIEAGALAELSGGRPAEAAAGFADAAQMWRGRMLSGYLRCTWAQGESLRRAGRTPEAVAVLTAAEELAGDRGLVALLARIQRSLRLCGVRRTAARRRSGALTVRERELLQLVSEGLSNAEISRRLGLSVSSVKRTIETASGKLGASSRLQAATLALRN